MKQTIMAEIRGFFAAVALIATLATAAAEPVTPPAREKFYLVLLIGQSNMAGRGFVTTENDRLDPRILMLDRSGNWVVASDPVHFDKPSAGVGPARSFAAAMAAADPEITVGLIPAACGGSGLDVWEPGRYFKGTKSHPYDDALTRARLAMKSGTLKAILFHQGESDCRRDRSAVYYDRLTALVKRLRADLGAEQVPFIIGQLSQWKKWSPPRLEVDAAHRRVAAEQAPAAFVTSEGLTPNPDNIHFDAGSAKILGRRYFEAYRKLIDPAIPAPRP